MPSSDVKFLYSGIRVRDLRGSIAFYRALGFRIRARGTMAHGGKWVHLLFPGSHHRLELNFYPRGNRFYVPFRKGTEFDHFGFYTPDVAGWLRTARRAGARLVEEFEDGKFRLVYVDDPNGVCLEAFGPTRPRKKKARKPRST
jgi:catechol 2,3-dioxygenase-like lactoylglutathione lyase family enzyme